MPERLRQRNGFACRIHSSEKSLTSQVKFPLAACAPRKFARKDTMEPSPISSNVLIGSSQVRHALKMRQSSHSASPAARPQYEIFAVEPIQTTARKRDFKSKTVKRVCEPLPFPFSVDSQNLISEIPFGVIAFPLKRLMDDCEVDWFPLAIAAGGARFCEAANYVFGTRQRCLPQVIGKVRGSCQAAP